MSIKVICDSTCYIPKALIEELDILVVSLNVIFKNESFRELDVDNRWFYEKMDISNEIPTSSQPSVDELYRTFENEVINGNGIVGVFMSSDMSGSYSTANMVKEMILEKYADAKIEIVDSRSNCMQMGYAVLAGARAVKEGQPMKNVLNSINNVISKSRFLFIPDNLTYLKKGGRIGGAAAFVGSILQIKPILTVEDGKTTVFDKVRTRKKAIDRMVEYVVEQVTSKGLGEVIVHHINCEDEGLQLAKRISDILKINVEICSIGPIIGLHVGPGSIGIVYYTKN